MTRVTILIPTFNRHNLIGKTIENCFEQSYKNFGILIYDDGSTDKTEEIVKKYMKKFPNRIKYIKGEVNIGIGASRKKLLENLETDYGVWLDSDDYMKRERLQKCFNYLEANKDIDVVYSNIRKFSEEQELILESNIITIDTSKYDKSDYSSLKSNTTCATAFFRKKLKSIEIVPLRYGSEDVLWLWKILNLGIKVSSLPEDLYLYRSHKHRLSVEKKNNKKEEKSREEIIIHQKIEEYGKR